MREPIFLQTYTIRVEDIETFPRFLKSHSWKLNLGHGISCGKEKLGSVMWAGIGSKQVLCEAGIP